MCLFCGGGACSTALCQPEVVYGSANYLFYAGTAFFGGVVWKLKRKIRSLAKQVWSFFSGK